MIFGNRNSMEIDFLLSNESPVNFKKRVRESSEVLPRLIKSPYKIYFLNIPYFMRVRKRLDAEKRCFLL